MDSLDEVSHLLKLKLWTLGWVSVEVSCRGQWSVPSDEKKWTKRHVFVLVVCGYVFEVI